MMVLVGITIPGRLWVEPKIIFYLCKGMARSFRVGQDVGIRMVGLGLFEMELPARPGSRY